MTSFVPQRLRPLPHAFVVERLDHGARVPDGEWLALVRAPEGLTVIRRARPEDAPDTERWTALYGGDTAHGLDVPGMLAALLTPLAAAAIPVFVASTFDADLVLVPAGRVPAAAAALRDAGHELA
ncbi:ACT domain-containing protein [Kitasatospora sp. NPDC047058]|uniref:ACT domain-containing protein n=1 Tax=Kitasatospora sp. NPDC047058 TaxID=3155620 RepID=UPI0033C827E3